MCNHMGKSLAHEYQSSTFLEGVFGIYPLMLRLWDQGSLLTGIGRPIRVPGIEPVLAVCKTRALPTVLPL